MVSICAECTSSVYSCVMYQQLCEDELFAIDNLDHGNPLYHRWITQPPRKEYLPLSTAKNWFEYYANILGYRPYIVDYMLGNFEVF